MKVIFLTEMSFTGKIEKTHENMRTEFAWMHVLNADHRPLTDYSNVRDYDLVIIIWPKGKVYLNSEGLAMNSDLPNHLEKYLDIDVVGTLKKSNSKVAYMQEGPAWFFNDYSIPDQFKYYNQIASSDIIYCHNIYDTKWYNGLFPNKDIRVMPTLMLDHLVKGIEPKKENKVMIGGNFCRWYGGFQSYFIANELDAEKWIPSMHNKREFEDSIEDLNHLPYMNWLEWMKTLSTFKYAVHLMPTVAAGTFALNCAYFGIPCIGNEKVDAQRYCFRSLSVDVEDVQTARKLAIKLREDKDFYESVSITAKDTCKDFFNKEVFRRKINESY